MIKKIKVTKKSKTITANFELELGQITVITGENNSGKTNFIKAVNSKKNIEFTNEAGAESSPKIVYIAAENIKPSETETKSSAKGSNLISNLSALFSSLGIPFELTKKDEVIDHI